MSIFHYQMMLSELASRGLMKKKSPTPRIKIRQSARSDHSCHNRRSPKLAAPTLPQLLVLLTQYSVQYSMQLKTTSAPYFAVLLIFASFMLSFHFPSDYPFPLDLTEQLHDKQWSCTSTVVLSSGNYPKNPSTTEHIKQENRQTLIERDENWDWTQYLYVVIRSIR